MTDSIGDLLNKQRFVEPPEIKQVRDFVEQRFKVTPQVSVTQKTIVIAVKSAALAGALRPLLHQLQADINTDKRLVIRIQ